MDDKARDEWLEERQDGRVYPVGRALRSTYGADNHDSLDTDVTGLMIDLSKVPYEDVIRPVEPAPVAGEARRSILARLTDLIGRQ